MKKQLMPKTLSDEHKSELQYAKSLLEKQSIAARFADLLASPIDAGMKLLPKNASDTIMAVSTKSIETALNAALDTDKLTDLRT